MRMAKFVWIAWIVVVVAGLWLWTQSIPTSPTPEQQAAAEAARKRDELRKQGKCPDETVIVEINGIVLAVPRNATSITLESGEKVEELEYAYRCNIKKVTNVYSVSYPYLSIGSLKELITMYDRQFDRIRYLRQKGKSETLENGIELIKDNNSEKYVIPTHLKRTGNNQPIVLDCGGYKDEQSKFTTQSCITSYVMPEGLRLSILFFRDDYSPSQYLSKISEEESRVQSFFTNVGALKQTNEERVRR